MSFDTALPPFNASDPQAVFLSSSCLDLLLIELVPMASRLVRELSVPLPLSTSSTIPTTTTINDGDGHHHHHHHHHDNQVKNSTTLTLDEDEEREGMFYRLESLGYRVGIGLVERYITSFLILFILYMYIYIYIYLSLSLLFFIITG